MRWYKNRRHGKWKIGDGLAVYWGREYARINNGTIARYTAARIKNNEGVD
jgi:hypothetical protein